jgi:4-hydroxybenzoate polyprenyltransferase
MNWWVVYQRERFPLAAHAPRGGVQRVGGASSSLLRGHVAVPSPAALVVAFVTSSFLPAAAHCRRVRDAENDARFRPYRPVPRACHARRACAWVQGRCSSNWDWRSLDGSLVWLLVPAVGVLVLMTREFFVPRWLRAHRSSHDVAMLILPLVDLRRRATGAWRRGQAPAGLMWFLAVSYPQRDRDRNRTQDASPCGRGARRETYSALWGAGSRANVAVAVLLTGAVAWKHRR